VQIGGGFGARLEAVCRGRARPLHFLVPSDDNEEKRAQEAWITSPVAVLGRCKAEKTHSGGANPDRPEMSAHVQVPQAHCHGHLGADLDLPGGAQGTFASVWGLFVGSESTWWPTSSGREGAAGKPSDPGRRAIEERIRLLLSSARGARPVPCAFGALVNHRNRRATAEGLKGSGAALRAMDRLLIEPDRGLLGGCGPRGNANLPRLAGAACSTFKLVASTNSAMTGLEWDPAGAERFWPVGFRAIVTNSARGRPRAKAFLFFGRFEVFRSKDGQRGLVRLSGGEDGGVAGGLWPGSSFPLNLQRDSGLPCTTRVTVATGKFVWLAEIRTRRPRWRRAR